MELIDLAMNLIDERERLGYSRKNFAAQVNMSTESLRLYEIGKTNMSAEFLAAAAQLGVDVQFVLTGVKSENLHLVSQKFEAELSQKLNENNGGIQFNSEVLGNPIIGNNNTVNNVNGTLHQGDVNNISTLQHITKTIAEVKPGIDHITEEQASKLQELVTLIVQAEEKVKRTPKSYRAVWSSLNSHLKVSKYRLIPLNKFEDAEKYLRKWLGRLTNTTTARKIDSEEYRKKRIRFIKTNVSKYKLDDWLTKYLQKNFGVISIVDLDQEQLDRAYHAVAYYKTKNDKEQQNLEQ